VSRLAMPRCLAESGNSRPRLTLNIVTVVSGSTAPGGAVQSAGSAHVVMATGGLISEGN
jgi:hypothetical protein